MSEGDQGEICRLKGILNGSAPRREDLVPLLQEIQRSLGYISRQAMIRVAEYLAIPPSEVYSVVSFYNQFRRQPLGKNHLQVCQGTACYLQGGGLIGESFARELEIGIGETTKDGLFSLDEVACLGCCNVAPVVKADGEIYPRMTSGKVEEVLINLKNKGEN